MNYAIDTPIKRTIVIPPKEPEPVLLQPFAGEQTQDHHRMTWLHHKPQSHAIFPIEPQSGRKK